MLNEAYIGDEEFDIYGYYLATNMKIVLLLKKEKINLVIDDAAMKIVIIFMKIFEKIHKIWQNQILNPFTENTVTQLKNSFEAKVSLIVNAFNNGKKL